MVIRKAFSYMLLHTRLQCVNRLKSELPRRVVAKYSPCALIIDVTTVCNMRCPYCSTERYRYETARSGISLHEAKEILNKYKVADFVGFCGAGEPFLNPDLFEMVKYGKQLRMKVHITTNGTLLHARMDDLLDSQADSLEISFKGACAKDYESITLLPNFSFIAMIEAVKALAQRSPRPRLLISYVCDRERIHNIPNIVEIAGNCGVKEVIFHNLIPTRELNNEALCLFEDDREIVSKLINRLRRNFPRLLIGDIGLYPRTETLRKCVRPFREMRIGIDGGISGCSRVINPNIRNGNALTGQDAFNCSHYRDLRSEQIHDNLPLRYECLHCGLRC